MRQYSVTGMSCAACVARVEKAVSQIPGVDTCSVSLLTNSMGIEGTASDAAIIQAVENAGYGAKLKEKSTNVVARQAAEEDALADKETPVLRKRLIASVVVLMPLLYLSMGHMLLEWPLPRFFDDNHVAMGLVQLVLTGLIMVINQKFFISGFKSLIHRAPNMDALVALGSSAAFLWSLYVLFAMTRAAADGNSEAVESGVEKILTIEGMMCEHCEKTVKNALENINGVKSAVVSYEKKQAVVHLSKEISDDILANAVEAKDYHVVQIA